MLLRAVRSLHSFRPISSPLTLPLASRYTARTATQQLHTSRIVMSSDPKAAATAAAPPAEAPAAAAGNAAEAPAAAAGDSSLPLGPDGKPLSKSAAKKLLKEAQLKATKAAKASLKEHQTGPAAGTGQGKKKAKKEKQEEPEWVNNTVAGEKKGE